MGEMDAAESETAARAALDARGIAVRSMRAVPPSIEDVFFQLTSKKE